MLRLKIADLFIDIDCPEQLIENSFFDFKVDNDEDKLKERDLLWKVDICDKYENLSLECRNVLINTDQLNVYGDNKEEKDLDNIDCIYLYKEEKVIPTAIVCKQKYSECNFYITNYLYNDIINNNEILENVKICLYNTFREVFVLACAYRNRIPIHSASVIYDNKAYLFSAPSGVGKSTHTNMWTELYDSEILDGDIAICGYAESINEDGDMIRKPYAYGLPWCGTSGIYVNKKVEFGGIVFIERSDTNHIFNIDNGQTAMMMFSNQFLPLLKEEILDKCLETITGLSEEVKGYILQCLPNHEAVEITKNKIIR